MLRGVEMASGVPVLGVVAARHMAAGHADAKVDPAIAKCDALGTGIRRVGLHIGDFVLVQALTHYEPFPLLSRTGRTIRNSVRPGREANDIRPR